MQILKRVLSFLISVLAYAYLLRFPLLTTGVVVGICFAAFFTGARSLLANAFDIGWYWGIFWVSSTAFVVAWVVIITSHLVLLYGPIRFRVSPDQAGVGVKALVIPLVLAGLVAFPVVGGVIYNSAQNNDWGTTETIFAGLFALLGALVALVLLWIAVFLQNLFIRPDIARCSPDVTLPLQGRIFAPFIDRAKEKNPAPTLAQKITDLFKEFPEKYWAGYFEYEGGEVVSVRPGHGFATVLLFLTIVLYAVVGILGYPGPGGSPSLPTLAYILLLLMLLCWVLSGLAFFLDRFRVPVIIPLLVLLLFTSQSSRSDHFYPLTEMQPSVAETDSSDTVIVVAANGGGIQASAWTARVLTGLEQELGEDFGGSIRVVSSVSGGSVGAMYFVNEYTEDGPPPEDELDDIVQRAKSSSLDKLSWGIVYPDFTRLFAPYLPPWYREWDRGRALEEAWLSNDPAWDNRENATVGLSGWREGVADRWRPGSIFNTTNTDTGARLPLSTIELPPGSEGKENQDELFDSLNSKDIPVSTATRLSASFPFVSPAARADNVEVSDKATHIVDGGYYDNYGISSLVEWLGAELEKGDVDRVLVLQIRGSRTGGDYELESNRGWFYQAFAPAGTALRVRDTGQLSHNKIELDLLEDRWEAERGRDDVITPVIFEFCGADPPLSWHLNEKEKEAIENDWQRERDGEKCELRSSGESGLDTVEERGADQSGLDTVREFLEQEEN